MSEKDEIALKSLVMMFNEASAEVKIKFVEIINKALEKKDEPVKRLGVDDKGYWNKKCPSCNVNQDEVKGTAVPGSASWSWDYECLECKTKFEVNLGDRMGGGIDTVTIK